MSTQNHLFTYEFNGAQYSLEIPADSREEAEARLAVLPWARYDGVLHAKIPARLGWFARAFCWVGNLFR